MNQISDSLSAGFPCGSVVKNLPAREGHAGSTPGQKDHLEEENGKPTPVFLPGKFLGQKSLAGYSPKRVTKIQTQLRE